MVMRWTLLIASSDKVAVFSLLNVFGLVAGGAFHVLGGLSAQFIFSSFFQFLVSVPLVQQRVQREIVTSDLFQIPA